MAKVKFSALVSGMRNKLNGSVFSVNAYGSYLRNKTSPVNPQTSHQQAQRQMLGSLSAGWRGLTQAQRNGWIDATGAFLRTDAFGDKQQLTGSTLYISLNKNLINAGQSTIDDAPTPSAIPTIAISDLVVDTGTPEYQFTIDPSSIPTGYSLAVKATPGISAGKMYVKNLLRFIGTESASSGTVDFESDYLDRFDKPADGQRVSVEAFLIDEATGQAGVKVSLTTLATS